MNNIFFIVLYVLAFVTPLFLIFNRFASVKTSVIISVGTAPLFVGLFNMINVALGINGNYLMYLVPLLFAALIYLIQKPVIIKSLVESKIFVKPMVFGLVLGGVYYYLFFYNYYNSGEIHCDTMWNLGLINNFKNYVIPNNPAWSSGEPFLYHYLTNWCFAGVSNFSQLSALNTVLGIGNYIVISSFLMILFIMISREYIVTFIVFVSFIIFSAKPDWIVSDMMLRHFNGNAVTSYFWSLPFLITCLYLFFKVRKIRDYNSVRAIVIFVIVNLFIAFVLGASKISNLLILIGVEFYFFIRYLLQRKRMNILSFFSFGVLPVFTLLFTFIYNISYANISLAIGIDAKDFHAFNSWNLLYPIFVLYGVVLFYIVFQRKSINQFRWEFLFASGFNFLAFLLFKHAGNSDLFFGLNSILCNFFFIVFSKHENKVKQLVYSICIYVFIAMFYNGVVGKGFFEISISSKHIRSQKSDYNFDNDRVDDLIDLSHKLERNTFMIVGNQEKSYTTLYSAILGVRTWNESVRYSLNTDNNYYRVSKYLKEEPFLKNIGSFPDLKKIYSSMLNDISKEGFCDDDIEKKDNRRNIFNEFVYSNIGENEHIDYIQKYKWTHLLIENKHYPKINRILKNKNRIIGKYYSIIKL